MESAETTRPGKDERRDAIVAIAKQIFLEQGYAGTSMSEIAARVGGSKATLYNYFKSKEELFIAMVEKKCGDISAMLNAAEMESGGDLRATLTNFGDHFVAYLLTDESVGFHQLSIGECARVPEIGQTIYRSGLMQTQDRIAALLEHARQEGRLRADADVRVAAEQFTELCLAGLHRRRLWNVTPCPSQDEIRTNVANAVDTFMRAYGV